MKKRSASPFYELNPNWTVDEKINLLNKTTQDLIFHFHRKANVNKRFYELYKYSSIILTGLTTVVASLQSIYPATFPQWMLPIVSAATTVAVAFLSASSAQKNWINSRTTQQHLQTELFLFNQQAGKYANKEKDENVRTS